ncbi:unnamed protein product [Albugo candida]|uniref:Uncharacterized protein n=1 Tax=Albugo candida TaxID=65357 RepID=A0A024GLJ5_9STRA|nr:unnamed protein product [Albugo candida]|eukprot:CCI47645.1 unnamed protein product [Albugo candida]
MRTRIAACAIAIKLFDGIALFPDTAQTSFIMANGTNISFFVCNQNHTDRLYIKILPGRLGTAALRTSVSNKHSLLIHFFIHQYRTIARDTKCVRSVDFSRALRSNKLPRSEKVWIRDRRKVLSSY